MLPNLRVYELKTDDKCIQFQCVNIAGANKKALKLY